jgi:hypothetical protein
MTQQIMTNASDMIASILQGVTAKLGKEMALDAVRLGIANFACQQAGNERFGADAWVRIKVECGGEVWHSQTGLGTTVIKEPS